MNRERQIKFLSLTFSLSVSDSVEVTFGLTTDSCIMGLGYFASQGVLQSFLLTLAMIGVTQDLCDLYTKWH